MGTRLLCRKAGASAFLNFTGELAHGLLRDDSALPTSKRSLGAIDGSENLRAGTLTLFPQGKGFVHGVFCAVQPAAHDSLANKRHLIRCKLYFHCFHGTRVFPAGPQREPSSAASCAVPRLWDPRPAFHRMQHRQHTALRHLMSATTGARGSSVRAPPLPDRLDPERLIFHHGGGL